MNNRIIIVFAIIAILGFVSVSQSDKNELLRSYIDLISNDLDAEKVTIHYGVEVLKVYEV
ncbi:MAG: hypothetical protein HQ568_10230 [Calditrichaeota bacterium]|nr:hypothetical protein [Calditrichota bacterium]